MFESSPLSCNIYGFRQQHGGAAIRGVLERHTLRALVIMHLYTQGSSPRNAGVTPAKSKKDVSLLLEKAHIEWLDDMAKKHNLPDEGKFWLASWNRQVT